MLTVCSPSPQPAHSGTVTVEVLDEGGQDWTETHVPDVELGVTTYKYLVEKKLEKQLDRVSLRRRRSPTAKYKPVTNMDDYVDGSSSYRLLDIIGEPTLAWRNTRWANCPFFRGLCLFQR